MNKKNKKRNHGIKKSLHKLWTKIKIDRNNTLSEQNKATKRVKSYLDKLEQKGIKKDINWSTEITDNLTVEEIVGALVAADQVLVEDSIDG